MKKATIFIFCLICAFAGHSQFSIADNPILPSGLSVKTGNTFSTRSISRSLARPACPCALSSIDPLQKSKRQKTIALILLGTGGALMVTSLIIPQGELEYDGICIGYLCSDRYKNDGIKSTLFVIGASSALASIPFFVIAGKNKRKANRTGFMFKMENAPSIAQNMVMTNRFPAAGVVLQLGK